MVSMTPRVAAKGLSAVAAAGMLFAGGLTASAKEATVAYQSIYNPWKIAIVDKVIEKASGYDIDWKAFKSGGDVITAFASGNLDVGLAGSSPIAAGVSRGIPIQLFWITENINDAEALVVRDGSGIVAPQDLRGKTIAAPFVSTTHFHVLFALEQFGISPSDVNLVNMQPNDMAAAWLRGDIDAAFVWDPALGRIKQSGKVLITSGDLSNWGKATFDGMAVSKKFASANPEFMCHLVKAMSDADAAYRDNPRDFDGNSANAKKIVSIAGGNASDVPGVLALYDFPTLEQQASSAWLGGGADGGAAKALRFTSEFLKEQEKIESLMSNYGDAVTDRFVKMAMKGC
jgi:taurine transport system substrate-binding protein